MLPVLFMIKPGVRIGRRFCAIESARMERPEEGLTTKRHAALTLQ